MTDYDDAEAREKNIKIFVRVLPLQKPCETCVRIDTECKDSKRHKLRPAGPWPDGLRDELHAQRSKKQLGNPTDHGSSSQHRGLVSRILYDLFLEKSNRKRVSKIQYRISFVELRGKDARDLLLPETENRIRINERDPFKEISVESVENQEQAVRKIFEGEIRRSIVKGPTYPDSHLATAVITVHATNASLITSGCAFTKAKMHIVEMAGIGTAGRTCNRKTASDFGAANLTKSQMEQFFSQFHAVGPMSYKVIRSSNLLKILGYDFPVASVIRFISHVRVTKEDLDVTLSTLRFTGSIARLKPIKVKKSMEYQRDHLVHRLRNEVTALKKELSLNELFLDQEASINISRFRLEQINRSVVNYLNNNINDFTLINAAQAQQLLKSIKDLYNRLTVKETEIEQLKERYENISKNMEDVGVSTRLSKESALSNQKGPGGQETLTETEDITIEEVGSIAKSAVGMTLGPCEDKEDDRGGDKALTITESAVQHKNILMVRPVFERFLQDEKEYGRIKDMMDKNARTMAMVEKKFTNWIDKYFQVKRTLENAKDKLSKHQQIRYTIKPEDDEELVPKAEILIDRDIVCYQRALLNLEEEVAQAQNEIRRLFKEQKELCSKLKSGFNEYCKEMDISLFYNDDLMKSLLEPVETESLDVAKRKFNQFQRAMTRKFEEKERIQKTERDELWTCFVGKD